MKYLKTFSKWKKTTRFLTYLHFFDIYAIPIQLNYKGKANFRSSFGAIYSLGVIMILFYYFLQEVSKWYNLEVSTIINSSEKLSATLLLKENRTMEYILDNQNYAIYFVLSAELPNKDLNFEEFAKYFTIEYKYSLTGYDSEIIPI